MCGDLQNLKIAAFVHEERNPFECDLALTWLKTAVLSLGFKTFLHAWSWIVLKQPKKRLTRSIAYTESLNFIKRDVNAPLRIE